MLAQTVYPKDVLSHVQTNNNHMEVRSGKCGGCASTSLLQCCTRFCTSQWWWGFAFYLNKMTPCSSRSGSLRWRVSYTLSSKSKH